jgi:hypothetical protein
MGYIILVQWPVYDMHPEVLLILFFFKDRSPPNSTTFPRYISGWAVSAVSVVPGSAIRT